MRKITILALIAGLLTLLSSCSKPEQHLKTIPSTAQLVASVDVFNMAQKAELYKPEQYAFYGEIMKDIETENPEMHSFIESLISNPLQTGLKYRKNLYIFAENLNKNPTIGLTMALRNGGDFEKTVNEALTTSKIDVKLNQVDGFKQLNIDEFALIFDDEKVLIIVSDGLKDDELLSFAQSLMKQSSDASITKHSDFAKFKSNEKDLNLWMSTDFMTQNAQALMVTNQLPFKTTGNYMHMHIDFNDKEIIGSSSWTFNEDIEDLLEKYDFVKDGFNTKILNFLPAENYATYGFAMNPSEIYRWINETPTYKPIIDQVSQGAPMSIEKMINSLGGDVIFAMHGFNLPETDETSAYGVQNLMPFATAILSMNNDELYKLVTTQMIPPGFFQLIDGYYSGSIMGFNLFFGLFENNLIVTNDKNIITNAAKGGLENNLGNTELKDLFSHSGFGYMNLNWEKYPEALKTMMQANMGQKEQDAFLSVTRILDEMRMYNKNNASGVFELKMRNVDKNSLHTIMQTIDDNRNL